MARHRTRDFSRVLLPGSPERSVARYGPGAQSRPEPRIPPDYTREGRAASPAARRQNFSRKHGRLFCALWPPVSRSRTPMKTTSVAGPKRLGHSGRTQRFESYFAAAGQPRTSFGSSSSPAGSPGAGAPVVPLWSENHAPKSAPRSRFAPQTAR